MGQYDQNKDKLIKLYPQLNEVLNNTLKAPDLEFCLKHKYPIAYLLMKYD